MSQQLNCSKISNDKVFTFSWITMALIALKSIERGVHLIEIKLTYISIQ